MKEVITENEHLHEAQKNKLISRMFHSYNAGSETDELDDLGDSTGFDSDNKVRWVYRIDPKSIITKIVNIDIAPILIARYINTYIQTVLNRHKQSINFIFILFLYYIICLLVLRYML